MGTKITITINPNNLKNLSEALEVAGRYVKEIGENIFEFSAKNRAKLFMEVINRKEEKISAPKPTPIKEEKSSKSRTIINKVLNPAFIPTLKIFTKELAPRATENLIKTYINSGLNRIDFLKGLEDIKALRFYPV